MTGFDGRRAAGIGFAVVTAAALVAQTAVGVRGALPGVHVHQATVRPAAQIPGLATTIDTILADGRLAGSQKRVVVKDAVTGEVLYNRNGTVRGNPASNEKLLTSAAAMDLLGPAFRFTTSVSRTGTVSGGRLTGNLYLRGTGDPTTLAADYDRLAGAVAAAGITSVSGYLGVDDTAFDAVRLGPAWSWDNEPYAYSAQVSALTIAPDTDYDAGAVAVTVRPAARGSRPTVSFVPASTRYTVDNRATTGAAGSARTLRVVRAHGSNRFVVTGSVPAGGVASRRLLSIWDPSYVAADVFRAALAKRGIRFSAAPVLRRAATPTTATRIATDSSVTLATLLTKFLKLSNNGHAEALVKAIGRKQAGAGTWEAGTGAIRTWLAANGVVTSAIRMSDGSGLSRTDLLTANQVTNLLRAVRGKTWFPTWYAALPVAGRTDRLVGGTLRYRMGGTAAAGNVHAKTGSLTSVSALSGYVTTAGGRRLVFSVIITDFVAAGVKDLEDRIAVALARSGSAAGAVPQSADDGSTGTGPGAPPRSVTVPDDPATVVDESQLECSWVGAC
ncbi:D-alanyl-D-alanine carboxypeptidase/D-alanyl-D-alanine-endopeptidase [Kineosporia sp. A_224]|uniref:D-alanyl-D-alanine carboxypeptidase/D-alanyl-D-alanine endopeptidase n=1 Tax=Kineosporia sp. A_224 TaxID=1962180 RepID=UPI000B4BC641|nr:D-alanyl-D-alanine carboxypeptidase/D-alanyl-D-alanine-endopeptidase [Kineosporia sp. A_224]